MVSMVTNILHLTCEISVSVDANISNGLQIPHLRSLQAVFQTLPLLFCSVLHRLFSTCVSISSLLPHLCPGSEQKARLFSSSAAAPRRRHGNRAVAQVGLEGRTAVASTPNASSFCQRQAGDRRGLSEDRPPERQTSVQTVDA